MMKRPAATARADRGTILEDGSDSVRVHALEQVREDPSDAIHVLYERLAPRVHAHLKRMVGESEAEDLTQQLFLKLLTAIGRYEPRQNVPFVAWLLRVTHNVAIDRLRTPRAVPTDDWLLVLGTPDDSGTERLRTLREALAELPRDQREVLVLRHIASLGPGEIAALLGRSEGSVHGRVLRQAAPSTLGVTLARAA